MKNIKVFDRTLIGKELSFKEKIEIVKILNNLSLDYIEIPEIGGGLEEEILVQTINQISKAKLSVSILNDLSKLDILEKYLPSKDILVRVEVPTSNVGMEYTLHKKGDKFIKYCIDLVSSVIQKGYKVDFVAHDATRGDIDLLNNLFLELVKLNVEYITICDEASNLSIGDFIEFIKKINVPSEKLGLMIDNSYGMALGLSTEGLKYAGAIKCAYVSNITKLNYLTLILKDKGNDYGYKSNLVLTNHKVVFDRVCKIVRKEASKIISTYEEFRDLDLSENLKKAIALLGYDLDEEDYIKVKNEFDRISKEKSVSIKELDVIISTIALQVPATYTLGGYVVNSGDVIKSSAQLTLIKDGEKLFGVEVGDGPIDAAFKAIEKLVGLTFDLDDFQIQSLTEGKEAVGNALVKIRFNGKLYSGNGVSTDIIESSIKAYLNAVNKIVYEEK